MIVLHHLAQDVERIRGGQMRIGIIDVRAQLERAVRAEHSLQSHLQLDIVFVEIGKELLCAEGLGDLLELVVVVAALEERLLLEDHASHHHPQRPNIQRIVVVLIGDQQLGPLEIPRTHSHVVVLFGKVELAEAPIDDLQLHPRTPTYIHALLPPSCRDR